MNEKIEELKILAFRNLNNYEKLEVERLKNKINEIIKTINILNKNKAQNTKQPTIFIDTQDMEERYGEQLYQDYLVEQNKDLQQENQKYKEVIDKAINNSQYWIDYYTRLNSDERIALRLQENIDILKEVE